MKSNEAWGELRSVVHRGRFNVVEELLPILKAWPSPWWRDEVILDYLEPHASLFDPANNPPPQPELLELWLRGKERTLLRLAIGDRLEFVQGSSWGKEVSSWAAYEDGMCECELMAWEAVSESELANITHWCREHAAEAPKYFRYEGRVRGLVSWDGWKDAPYFWFDDDDDAIALYLAIDDLREMSGPYLVPTLEMLFQISQRIAAPALLARDWDFADQREQFAQVWQSYLALRQPAATLVASATM